MITISQLDNGVTIATSASSHRQTACVGLWLKNGARHQSETQTGYAHFLEHLVFKKTTRRTGRQLAEQFEAMGGEINAETGRELTCFHGTVPSRFCGELLQLFIEMLTRAAFDENDFRLERDVVLQELAMLRDDPEEALEDFGTEQVWPRQPMGRQILGDLESLANSSKEILCDYLDSVLAPENIMIVATGKIDHEQILRDCKPLQDITSRQQPGCAGPRFTQTQSHLDIDAGQRHLLWVMPAVPCNHRQQPACDIASHILAGGYDSYLYQALREETGLVYSVDSRVDHYSDTGLWFIQTNTDSEHADKVTQTVVTIVDKLVSKGPHKNDLDKARKHLQSSLVLEQDDLESEMDRLARDLFYSGRIITLDEKLRQFEQVTPEDIRSIVLSAWGRVSHFTAGPASR